MERKSARFYTFLSIGAALLTIALKAGSYFLTGSVGLLSDAAESIVNLVAAIIATWAVTYAAKPPDEQHAFGHYKAEYFSSGVEGALILVAAVSIAIAAWGRLFHPQPIEQLGLGLGLSLVATVINGALALAMLRASKRLRSITLRADAHHLMTDVWTSIGVVLGLILVPITHWLILDPIIAFIVAVNIVWTGIKLLRETGLGLLDTAMPESDKRIVTDILATYDSQIIQFHALRSRVAGARRFVSLHVLVPGAWTVKQGHDLCEEIELAIEQALPGTYVFTHLEPLEDPLSWQDQHLEREYP
ncbi:MULTISPECIES: cation diffusion facilitator family transporter [unclassified Leptolyngbya]|uniref:cation diffusion facilitator family transporter n=1 Tax=unclassified Leptolyngbya TaxID=2650499 RepID=UPI001688D887|nr:MULTISPECIES: cation diffusion facilitator family transporter [unclassified Leptolyngbya]MBD1909931.1 cation transporter [Leptolyngbya sp. FACHB-8]MBD2158605.1 cation transporter [Leptolyngbya sp. FACHB-16]